MNFLIYHSGFVSTVAEKAYDPTAKRDGIDTLIRSLVENGVKPGSERLSPSSAAPGAS